MQHDFKKAKHFWLFLVVIFIVKQTLKIKRLIASCVQDAYFSLRFGHVYTERRLRVLFIWFAYLFSHHSDFCQHTLNSAEDTKSLSPKSEVFTLVTTTKSEGIQSYLISLAFLDVVATTRWVHI